MNTPNKVVFDVSTLRATHQKLKRETSREMIQALGHNPDRSDTTAHVTTTVDYKNASRSAGQVSYSHNDQIQANYELSKKDAQHGGTLHTHIEAQGHAWEWSAQDKATIKASSQDPLNQYHVLTYVGDDGSTRYKAMNGEGKEVPLVTNGMNISNALMGVMVSADGKIKQVSTNT